MANNLIQVKRTSVSGRAANSTTLPNPGELALNMTDGILYSTNGSTVFEIGANNTNAQVSGTLTAGNGVFSGNVSISGNLVVNGGIVSLTGNVITFTDNMLYLNQGVLATITNITSNGTHVVFTANNNFSAGWDVFVSGVDPSSYNGNYVDITAANSTTFTVANTNTASYVSGGTARGKTDQNPDLGIAAGYNDGTYHHTGIFRDATDARWKVYDNYGPEPDSSPYIDTANSTFHLADFQANTLYLGNTTANWLVANTSGVYHTGTVNATSFTGNLTGNVVATNVNAATIQVSTSVTLDNDNNLSWKAKNTSTVVGMRQQNDDNFVFYSTDATYAARPVFAIYANSSTSNLQMLVPLNLVSKLGANGSFGTSGQVLTTNGSGVYWSAAGSGSVDVNAQYAWTNTHTFSANVSFTGNGIGIASNTGAIYLGGIGDANWKIGRNTGVVTKWKYTNNTIDIATANSNLEGMTIGLVNGNSYFETGYLGTFIASNVTVGSSTSNISINATAFVGNVVATSISGNLTGNVAATTISGNLTGNVAATTISGNLTGNVVATTISGNLTGNVAATTITGNLTGNVAATTLTGNLTGNVAAITISGNLTGNVISTTINATANVTVGANVLITTANLAIGNATANVYVNSTAFVGNTVGVHSGNVIATTLSGNLTGNVVATTISGNLTGNVVATTISGNLTGNVAATIVSASSNIAVGANVLITTANLAIGNATANVYVNSTAFVGNTVGVHTGNVVATSVSGNLTGNVAAITITGNLTGNVIATTISGNLTGNVTATTITGNLTGNVVAGTVNATTINATSSIVVGANVSLNTSILQIGNSTVKTTVNTTAFVGNVVATTVTGNLTGNVVATTISGNLTGNVVATTLSGNLTAVTANVTNKLQIGAPGSFDFGSNAVIEIDANGNTYVQSVIQNANTGNNASADLVVTNDTGNDSFNYVDLGINGSNYNQPGFNITGQNDAYLYASHGNLAIGTAAAGKEIIFHAGGTTTTDRRLTVNSSAVIIANAAALVANGSTGTAGQILTSNSTGAYWSSSVNNALNLGGVAAASYQLNSTLNANVAAYLPTYTGVVNASTFQVGTAFKANTTDVVTANLTVQGNLIVTGTTVTLNTATLDVKDLNITLAKGTATAAAANGAGITVDAAFAEIVYINAGNTWLSNINFGVGNSTSNVSINSTAFIGNVVATRVTANLTGNVTATSITGNLTGNVVATTISGNLTGNVAATTITGNLTGNVVATTITGNLTGNVAATTITGNLTGNVVASTVNATTINATSSIVVGANVLVNTSTLAIGNATANVFVNSTAFVGNVVATSISGNLTGNVLATTVNAASHTVGTAFTANATVVNAVSYYAGTLLVANTTVINATHLAGVAGASYVQNTDSRTLSGNLVFAGSNTTVNAVFRVVNSTANVFFIGADGNIGIGETSPLRKLTVRGDSTGSLTVAAFYNADTTANNGSVFSFRSDTTGTGAATFQEFAAITGRYGNHDHATRSGGLDFYTVENGTGANRMSVVANGNVGIGTDTPTNKLHILGGGFRTTGGDTFVETNLDSAGGYGLTFQKSRGTYSSKTAAVASDIIGGVWGAGYDGTSYLSRATVRFLVDGTVSTGNIPTAIAFRTGTSTSTEYMRITSGGNVGIANTSPDATLAVTGTANVSANVRIGGTLTAVANVVLGTTTITANGGVGTAGQVLTSGATGNVYWATPTVGDITGVTAGDGLTGGGTSGDVTLNVGASDGITVAADAISVTQGTGVVVNATGVHVNAAHVLSSMGAASDANTATNGIWRLNTAGGSQPAGTDYGTLLSFDNASDTGLQIASDYQSGNLYWRSGNGPVYGGAGSFGVWREIVHDGNYTDYTVTKTGTGASGTWGISITGTANIAAPAVLGSTTANGASLTYANVSGQVNTATLYATTSANVASIVQANSLGVHVGANVVANTTTLKVGNTTITTTNAVFGGTIAANGGIGTAKQVLVSGAAANASWATLDMSYIPDAVFKKSVRAATTADLAAASATSTTITGTLVVLPAQDGITLVVGDRLLVKDQATPAQNGIYEVTVIGVAATTAWVLTRTADADSITELAGAFVSVDSGTVNGGRVYDNDLKTTDTLGTTAVNWSKNIDDAGGTFLGNVVVSGAATGIFPTSNTSGFTFGNTIARWVIIANSGNFSTTLAAGNTTVTGFVNATSTVNASSLTVGTAFTANATVVNAVSYYSGTLLVANTTVINATHLTGYTFAAPPVIGSSTANGISLTYANVSGQVNAATLLLSTNTATIGTGTYFIASGNVGIGVATPAYKLQVNGSFAATTKSFVIDHPTKPDMKLRYGSLEGPENGVYVRGKSTSRVIELPDYWESLVDEDSITVTLTAIGKKQRLYVKEIRDNAIVIGGSWKPNYFYTVYAERKDVEKLAVEF